MVLFSENWDHTNIWGSCQEIWHKYRMFLFPLYGQVQREKLKTAQDTKVGIAVRVVRLDDFDRNANL